MTFLKVDEEKKVDAVREFYKTVIGDMDAVKRLQLISGFHFIKLSQFICNWNLYIIGRFCVFVCHEK